MKIMYYVILFLFIPVLSIGQNKSIPHREIANTEVVAKHNFKLFPTQNYWTFIKLDTRNGKM